MRLFEFSNNAVSDLIILLRNQIKRADSTHSYAMLSWEAINNLMADMGHGIYKYDDFKNAYDTVPALKQIVKNFNQDGVTLATSKESPKEKPLDIDVKPTNTVDQMQNEQQNVVHNLTLLSQVVYN